MKVDIRLAGGRDFDLVGKVFAEENRFHADLLPEIIQTADPIMTAEWFEEVLNNPHKTLFVAEAGSEVVGVALVELRTSIDDPIFRPRKYAHINEVAVAEPHRGKGIGQFLMEKIHIWGQEQGVHEIELQVWERNEAAIGFYQKLGYQPWRRTMRLRMDDGN